MKGEYMSIQISVRNIIREQVAGLTHDEMMEVATVVDREEVVSQKLLNL
jgi:putative lipoic acid-binding regulatory protein